MNLMIFRFHGKKDSNELVTYFITTQPQLQMPVYGVDSAL